MPRRADAHIHLFEHSLPGSFPTRPGVQIDEAACYDSLAKEHDVAAALIVCFTGVRKRREPRIRRRPHAEVRLGPASGLRRPAGTPCARNPRQVAGPGVRRPGDVRRSGERRLPAHLPGRGLGMDDRPQLAAQRQLEGGVLVGLARGARPPPAAAPGDVPPRPAGQGRPPPSARSRRGRG